MKLKMIALIISVLAPAASLAKDSEDNIWECWHFVSGAKVIRVRVKDKGGKFRVTYNDGPQGNMSASSTYVVRDKDTKSLVQFSGGSSSSLYEVTLKIFPNKKVTLKGQDGSPFPGVEATVEGVQQDLRNSSGKSTIKENLSCQPR